MFERTSPNPLSGSALLASVDFSRRFSTKLFSSRLETWYTSRQFATAITSTKLVAVADFQVTFFEGREPVMTRIPLNRAYEQSQDMKDKLEMSTAEIGLAVRTTNCLEERGVFTVNDLLHCTREDLLSISNFGEKTLEEVYKALESVGFYRPGQQSGHL
jgi:DNA-directed RNA polymerase subunit alpha